MKKIKVLILSFITILCSSLIVVCTTVATNYDINQNYIIIERNIEQTDQTNQNASWLNVIQEYCEANGIDFEEYISSKLSLDYIKTATNKALRSAVSVWCVTKYQDSAHLSYSASTGKYEPTKSVSSSAGAGTIYKVDTLANGEYDMDGFAYIITNYHVVYSSYSTDANHMPTIVKIFQYGTNEKIAKTDEKDADGYPAVEFGTGAIDAVVLGGSQQYDLAVLRVKNSELKKFNSSFRPADIANGYEVADQCIAIGNPDAMGLSVTQGIISVNSENISLSAVSDNSSMSVRVMRIDAPVNSGNSGGGLFNTKGQLIGVVNAKSTKYDEMNYAIPIDNAIKVVDNIIDGYLTTNSFYYPKKLVWGIVVTQKLVSNDYIESADKTVQINNIEVTTINSGAYAEGSLQVGDIIKSITITHQDSTSETYQINKSYELSDILFTIRAGDAFAVFGDRGESTDIVLMARTVEESNLTEIK